jgi:hypothetical protein
MYLYFFWSEDPPPELDVFDGGDVEPFANGMDEAGLIRHNDLFWASLEGWPM